MREQPTKLHLVAGKFPLTPRTVVSRSGQANNYQIVDHPGGVVVLPRLDDDQVVMIHNFRHALGRELLELPAGTLEPPESPADCARRELTEETGYRAANIRPMGTFYTCPGFSNELLYAFLAESLTLSSASLQDAERIRVQVFRFQDALDLIADGQIVDAKTIAVLLMHDRFGHRRP
jgi:ADP-ribose pyrophosphatase